jgi:hypothetical protein
LCYASIGPGGPGLRSAIQQIARQELAEKGPTGESQGARVKARPGVEDAAVERRKARASGNGRSQENDVAPAGAPSPSPKLGRKNPAARIKRYITLRSERASVSLEGWQQGPSSFEARFGGRLRMTKVKIAV